MDLLSYTGQVTKRRARFEERARDLSSDFPSVDSIEDEMKERSKALVYRLEKDKVRFSEFQRAAADETIITALAGIRLGGGDKMMDRDESYAASTKALPYLWRFYNDIQEGMDVGRITQTPGDEREILSSPTRYAPKTLVSNDPLTQDILDMYPGRNIQDTTGRQIPATWEGVQSRLDRYLATPAFGWEQYGAMGVKRATGFKEARRVAALDKACCEDCIAFDKDSWKPIGLLPPPGQGCRCRDRCRCYMEYR